MKKGWEVKKLGEVCAFLNGKAHEKDIDNEGEYIVVNSKFISSDGKKIKKTNKQLSPLYKNDIVMVMSDVPKGKALSKCFIIDKDDKYSLNQRICSITTHTHNLNNKYLYHFINRNTYFLSFDNGENQTNLRKNDILKCPILIPPLSEQQRIVEILDIAFEKIDTVKQNAERNLQNAKELFQSVLDTLFINSKSFGLKQIEDILQKTETINPLKKPDTSFKYIDVSSVSNKTYSIEESSTIIGKDAPSRARKLIKKGDVIFATVRPTLKRITIIPKEFDNEICSTGYCVLSPSEMTMTSWIFYFLQTTSFLSTMERLQRGASYPAVTDRDIKKQKIPVPPLPEQQQIVSKLDALSARCKELENNHLQTINGCDELKKAILAKAFNGEL